MINARFFYILYKMFKIKYYILKLYRLSNKKLQLIYKHKSKQKNY